VIHVCCDSGAQLGAELAQRHGIEVVPLTVTVDGVPYLEGVDLEADRFWAMFDDGHVPSVSTAAPSPGQFLEAYERLLADGATEIVSVHTGSSISATFDAARLASTQVDVPVELVDTGSASFVVGCAALAAAERIAAGGSAADAARAATSVAAASGNVFVVGALDLARAGGRLARDSADSEADGSVPVLRLLHGEMSVIGHADGIEDAATKMAAEILATGDRLRVGLSVADPGARPIVDALRSRLDAASTDLDLLEYRVGPSVGAHTGPGTAGAVYHPI
jgi:DegV family protein with EDD domain